MSVLARYLSQQILASVGLVLLGLVLLFSFFELIDELDDLQQGSYTLGKAMLYVLLNMPARLHELMPIAVVIGALFAFARLASSSEFNVMRASGLSPRRLIQHLTLLGAGIALVILLVGEFITPISERAAQQLKIRTTSNVVAQSFKTGLWAKDGQSFINAAQMLPDSSLVGLRIFQFNDRFHLQRIDSAERAVWKKDGEWQLETVTRTEITATGTHIEHLPTMNWRSSLNPDLLSVLMVAPERMALRTLHAYIQHLRDNRQKAQRYEIALWNKIAYPLAAPIMLLLALPFAYSPPRAGGVGGRVMAGVLIGLGFYMINRLSAHLGLINDWSPVFSAALPLIAFGGAAAAALWLVERR